MDIKPRRDPFSPSYESLDAITVELQLSGIDWHSLLPIATTDQLASSVPNSAVIPMCTSDYSQYTLAVCGFGYVAANNKKFPSTLLETQLTELGQQCPFTQLDTSKLVCTRGQNTQTCPGDSGSPLFPVDGSNRAICHYGILSLGDCTPGRTDSLYTRVSAYQKWIKKYM
ncbi:fibrinolytic enzyme, isozyme C-like isoform X3 [Convolutriloba macropyga]|uniref:fibrinolytic enzyme, isozyme C-like isoform X3 n=1 Tax=Convolutriloba macropyga TaxID=536237 RepID=UPI003F5221A9